MREAPYWDGYQAAVEDFESLVARSQSFSDIETGIQKLRKQLQLARSDPGPSWAGEAMKGIAKENAR